MWVYRAFDEDGCIMAEAYRKADLISKLEDEFGDAERFTIVRVFERWLR